MIFPLHFIFLSIFLSAWQLMKKKSLPESFLIFHPYEVYATKTQPRICRGWKTAANDTDQEEERKEPDKAACADFLGILSTAVHR